MSVFRVTLINFDPDNDQESQAFQKILCECFEIPEAQVTSVMANLPSILTENLSKNIAESSVKKLKELGAVVALEEIPSPAEAAMKASQSEDPLDFNFNFDESFSFEEKKETVQEAPLAAVDSQDSALAITEITPEAPAAELDFDFSFEESAKGEPVSDFSFDFKEPEDHVSAASETAVSDDLTQEGKKQNADSPNPAPTNESVKQNTATQVIEENPAEEIKTANGETSKKKSKKLKLDKKTQISICASLAITLLAVFYQLDPFGLLKEEPQTTSNINGEMADALLQAQQAILAPPTEAPTSEPTPTQLEERYWTSTLENKISTTEAKILSLGSEITEIQLNITTPKPRKLTFDEIAQNKLEPVWVERADVKIVRKFNETMAREEKDIAFKLQGNARTFLTDSIGSERLFADIDVVGSFSKDDNKIIGVWEIRYGPITNRLQDYNFVERLSKKEFAVYYKGRFEAVLTEKPKTYELSLDSLQKMGIDINRKEGSVKPPPAQ